VKVIIIGAGRIGASFGYLLQTGGHEIIGVKNKSKASAQRAVEKIGQGAALSRQELVEKLKVADLVMVTTPDDKISEIVDYINSCQVNRDSVFMHMSGLLPAEILYGKEKKEKKENKRGVFSLHPLLSVPDFETGLKTLPEANYVIEGSDQGLKVGHKICRDLNLSWSSIDPEKKPLYHAAAVLAANYLVTLIGCSYELLEEAGISDEKIKNSLLELSSGVLKNIKDKSPESVLTGPVARGDWETVALHLESIKKNNEDLVELYRVLGKYTTRLIGKKNIFKGGGIDGQDS